MFFVGLACNMLPEFIGVFCLFGLGFFCFPDGINFVWLEHWAF